MKQVHNSGLRRFGDDCVHHPKQVAVTLVPPAALFGYRLDRVRGGPPAFLGRLQHVSGIELAPGLFQHPPAGFYVKVDRCQCTPIQ